MPDNENKQRTNEISKAQKQAVQKQYSLSVSIKEMEKMEQRTNTKPIYRMSSAGYCPRALSAMRLDMEPEAKPVWLEQAAEEGNWHEQRIKEELMAQGYQVFSEQEEYTIGNELFDLVGHIDAIVYTPEKEQILLEVKSMSQFEFDRWMRGKFNEFPNYLAQASCYLAATELPQVLYIVKNRNSGYKWQQTYDASSNAFNFGAIMRKLRMVEELALEGKLAEAEFNPDSYECRRCSYKHLCIGEVKETLPVDQKILEAAVERYRKGKQLEAEATMLIDHAKDILGAYADDQPTKKFVFNNLSVNKIHVHRESFDKKKLLEIFKPEQLQLALKISEYAQLRIDDLEVEKWTSKTDSSYS